MVDKKLRDKAKTMLDKPSGIIHWKSILMMDQRSPRIGPRIKVESGAKIGPIRT